MARAIDGDALKRWCEKIIDQACHPATVQIGEVFLDKVRSMPTLTPPNEWVNRVRELDELYTKLQIVTGFTAEQLLEIFAAGYTLEKPDYSKKFAEMENLAEAAQPNEPLTIEQLREMGGQPYWHVGLREESSPPHWNILDPFYAKHIEDYRYGENWLAYRRPPEGEEHCYG